MFLPVVKKIIKGAKNYTKIFGNKAMRNRKNSLLKNKA